MIICMLPLLSGCVTEVIEGDSQDKFVSEVSFFMNNSIEADDDDDTRVIVKYTGNYNTGGYQNFIFNGDTIGIFPSKGDQIPFVIEGLTTEAPSFTFEARGWDLRTDVTYYAYIPFDRSNYADSINIRHVNVSYVGQVLDTVTAKTNGLLVENFNNLSQYSYLYSTPTNADAGGNLNFNMQYLGGIVRLRLYFKSMPPGVANYTDIRIMHSQLTADDPVYIAEGTYALDTIAKEKEAADLAGTGASYEPKITPTKRGLVNVLPMKIDTIRLFNIAGSNYGFYYYINLPVTHWKGHNPQLILYDTDYNWYYSDLSSLNNTSTAKVLSKICYLYYGGKASPKDIKISPWDDEEEIINSNWNYK